MCQNASHQTKPSYCQTPDLGLGLGVDFTFPNNKKNNNNNPHLIFHRREGTRGLKFGTQTYWIQVFKDLTIYGFMDLKIYGFMDLTIYGFRDQGI